MARPKQISIEQNFASEQSPFLETPFGAFDIHPQPSLHPERAQRLLKALPEARVLASTSSVLMIPAYGARKKPLRIVNSVFISEQPGSQDHQDLAELLVAARLEHLQPVDDEEPLAKVGKAALKDADYKLVHYDATKLKYTEPRPGELDVHGTKREAIALPIGGVAVLESGVDIRARYSLLLLGRRLGQNVRGFVQNPTGTSADLQQLRKYLFHPNSSVVDEAALLQVREAIVASYSPEIASIRHRLDIPEPQVTPLVSSQIADLIA